MNVTSSHNEILAVGPLDQDQKMFSIRKSYILRGKTNFDILGSIIHLSLTVALDCSQDSIINK